MYMHSVKRFQSALTAYTVLEVLEGVALYLEGLDGVEYVEARIGPTDVYIGPNYEFTESRFEALLIVDLEREQK
jgi:hypothetical protein